MRSVLAHLTDVRPGEGRIVLQTTATLFSLIAGHTLLETCRDALFLGNVPARLLTIVYAAVALLAVVSARANSRMVARFGRRASLHVTLVAAAYGAVLFYLLPRSSAVLFALYVFTTLTSSVAVVQFWMLAGHWLTVAQGRRLFGLISAGGVLGAVCGAGLAVAALHFVEVESLLLVAVGFFLFSAALISTVRAPDEQQHTGSAHASYRASWKLVRSYPYVGRLAVLWAISACVLLVTDYLFKSVAARSLPASELGTFFARFYAAFNGIALVLQIVGYGFLVRRLGVLSSFFVLPVMLLGGAVATVVTGGFLAVVLATKAFDGGLRHSLHRVTSELLWLPLPDEVRVATKTFVDTVPVRLSQAVTGGVLLLLASRDQDGPIVLAGGIAMLALLWLGMAARLRKPYLALLHSTLGTRPGAPTPFDLDGAELVIEALSSRNPRKVVAAMDLLAHNGRTRLIPALILYHESSEVLTVALRTITTTSRSDWIPLAKRLLEHEDVDVRVAAMSALHRVGIEDAVQERVYDVRPEVRGHAAYLVEARSREADPLLHPAIIEVLELTGVPGAAARLGLLRAVCDAQDGRYAQLILTSIEDRNDAVAEAAAEAMVVVRDERFIPRLVARLASRSGRQTAMRALVVHGEAALTSLHRALADVTTTAKVRRFAPAAIASFGTQKAADILLACLAVENVGLVRYKILKALAHLVQEVPLRVEARQLQSVLDEQLVEFVRMAALAHQLQRSVTSTSATRYTSALLQLLGEKARQAQQRAFMALGILHRNEDIRVVESALRSADRSARARALEFVDALTANFSVSRIRRLFNLMLDDLPVTEMLERASDEVAIVSSPEQALRALLDSDDEVLWALSRCCLADSAAVSAAMAGQSVADAADGDTARARQAQGEVAGLGSST